MRRRRVVATSLVVALALLTASCRSGAPVDDASRPAPVPARGDEARADRGRTGWRRPAPVPADPEAERRDADAEPLLPPLEAPPEVDGDLAEAVPAQLAPEVAPEEATAAAAAAAAGADVGEDPALLAAALPTTATGHLEVDGRDRTFEIVRPERPRRRPPLVIVLHGRGGTGAWMMGAALDDHASRAGAVTVYPDGLGGSWNDDRPGLQPPVVADDVAFLEALVEHLALTDGIDPLRVALVGWSNGALMTSRFACERAGAVAVIVLVGGAGGAGLRDRCRPARHLPVLIVTGTADDVVPYDGGAVAGSGRGIVAPTMEAVALWAAVDGCTHVVTTQVSGDLERLRGAGCVVGAEVRHERLLGGTHTWDRPGFDTTEVVWGFVARHLRRGMAPRQGSGGSRHRPVEG